MAKKKYYAIAKGRKPGIYDNWPQAEAQVKRFQGAVFKGFAIRREAEAFLKSPIYQRPSARTETTGKENRSSRRSDRRPCSAANTTQNENILSGFSDAALQRFEKDSIRSGEVTIYTDGGSINNPGPGGYGVVQIYNGERKELCGGYRLTTNNRMELMACVVALRELEHKDAPVTVYSDSGYVVNGITKGWAASWQRNGWIKSDKKPAVNPDLWGELLELVEGLDITFKWVKGHAGNPLNERCDELANGTARQGGLPVDRGYESLMGKGY
jgi:ribonuclease HI